MSSANRVAVKSGRLVTFFWCFLAVWYMRNLSPCCKRRLLGQIDIHWLWSNSSFIVDNTNDRSANLFLTGKLIKLNLVHRAFPSIVGWKSPSEGKTLGTSHSRVRNFQVALKLLQRWFLNFEKIASWHNYYNSIIIIIFQISYTVRNSSKKVGRL